MGTIKYRINGGQWQTFNMVPKRVTGFTLTSSEYVPSEWAGTYVYNGTAEGEYGTFGEWVCNSINKKLYSTDPAGGFYYLYLSSDVNPQDPQEGEYFYVIDSLTYNYSQSSNLEINVNVGDEIEIIYPSEDVYNESLDYAIFGYGAEYFTFKSTCKFDVSGNIKSVTHGEGFNGSNIEFYGFDLNYGQDAWPIDNYWDSSDRFQFQNNENLVSARDLLIFNISQDRAAWLFSESGIVIAPEMLPDLEIYQAESYGSGMYAGMFYNCENLTTPPELPATTLGKKCYSSMFNGCSSLTKAPELPATTLTSDCYNSMFYDCAGLTSAPELPATTLAEHCYYHMFNGCTSLTSAPELPATTLSIGCYNSMFYGCTGLTVAPALPATTLMDSCYSGMFEGCTSLTTAPELPATTLVNYCYSRMFYGCTSLNYIKAMFTTNPSNSYTGNWVYGVSSTGTFVKNASATWTTRGANAVPNNWTIETA